MIVFWHPLDLGKPVSTTLKHKKQQIYHPFSDLADYKERGLKHSRVKMWMRSN